jgi:hypothetical protein
VFYVGNEHLSLGFDLSDGLVLRSLLDKATGHNYVAASRSARKAIFFLFRVRGLGGKWAFYTSRDDLEVVEATLSPDGHQLQVTARGKTVPLLLSLMITVESGQKAAICELSVRSEAEERMSLRFEYPKVRGIAIAGDPATVMGALPIEIGTVGPLRRRPTLGMGVDEGLGLPHGLNFMEVASIYEPEGGGGLFFADLDGGTAPLQFLLSSDQVVGTWIADLELGEEAKLPRLAIGVYHEGDWHKAVDYYVSHHRENWRFPETPAWLKEAGALYACSGEGGGGIFQVHPTVTLKDRIGSFNNLTQLLDEAKQLGTNVIYLYDYWEGAEEGPWPPYWNKGDYIPRADMGGSEAFKAGVASLHAQGGRVILYVEPFIVYHYSQIGESKGSVWSGRGQRGDLYAHYPDNYSMCASFRPWQDYVANVAQRLVEEYGADGVYLDSYGWQWNWPCFTLEGGELASASEWNQGVLDLIDRVRTAIQAIDPEAVVLTESLNGLLVQHVDGGLDASFAWQSDMNGGQILASPTRYGMPQANFYSNGRNLNQLNQVYAAGFSLALSYHWLDHADYIRKLVEIRQQYKDVLVYGPQVYQPATGSDVMGAYFYEGAQSQIITAVNTSKKSYQGSLTLRSSESNSKWRDLLTDEVFSTYSGEAGVELALDIPGEGLRVLVREL